ncbi:hypothetical protein FSARC_10681 [Fusarium sarcochroum]|uniref:Uncharacterized protein n=1 Tax=Fusarium sarcochroum TaxID=1208366 RepID=A0A8H4TKH1_9HYPO|nr:hypothetical protein FSARC_10681 [Fusarium sarcochroum]
MRNPDLTPPPQNVPRKRPRTTGRRGRFAYPPGVGRLPSKVPETRRVSRNEQSKPQAQHDSDLEEVSESEHEREIKRKLNSHKDDELQSLEPQRLLQTQNQTRGDKGKGKQVTERLDDRAAVYEHRISVVSDPGSSNQLSHELRVPDGALSEPEDAGERHTSRPNENALQLMEANSHVNVGLNVSNTGDGPPRERPSRQEQVSGSIERTQVPVQENVTAQATALEAALNGVPADPIHLQAALRVILQQQTLMSRITPGSQLVPQPAPLGHEVVLSSSHAGPSGSESLTTTTNLDAPTEDVQTEEKTERAASEYSTDSEVVEHNEIPCVRCLRRMCKNFAGSFLCMPDESKCLSQKNPSLY